MSQLDAAEHLETTASFVNSGVGAPLRDGCGWSVVSLFAGCGGLDFGFKELNFDLVYACDSDPAAVACYRHNVDPRIEQRDVNTTAFIEDLRRLPRCDVVVGGFPCQGFSKAGPKREEDERNSLYLRMRQAVEILRPRLFLAENVDGIEQNYEGIFVKRIRQGFTFENVAYDVDYRVLDAHAFGVPQYRRRAFFVGRRRPNLRPFAWPVPTHERRDRNGEFKVASDPPLFTTSSWAERLPPPQTIRDAIEDLQQLDPSIPDHAVTNNWPTHYEHVIRRIGSGQKLCNVRHSPTSVYTWQVPEAFGVVSSREQLVLETISRHRRHKKYGNIPNGNPLPIPVIELLSGLREIAPEIESLLSKNYLKPVNNGYDLKGAMFCSGLFKRPQWDEPSPTVLTNFHNPRYFLHPSENRPFTLRECARLQSFDDSFEFLAAGVSLLDGYRLVGNAVAPKVGRAFAVAFCQELLAIECEGATSEYGRLSS